LKHYDFGRDAQFSLTYGRMYLDLRFMVYREMAMMRVGAFRGMKLHQHLRISQASTIASVAFKLTTITTSHQWPIGTRSKLLGTILVCEWTRLHGRSGYAAATTMRMHQAEGAGRTFTRHTVANAL
jgi:hypothetical protein